MNPSYVRKLRVHINIAVPEWLLPLVVAAALSFGQAKDRITVQNR
jgi:hypothetical protein